MEINIKRWDNENVIFSYSCKYNTISKTVEEAIKLDVDLSYACLKNTNLSYANLSNADLSNADLTNTNLKFANLSNADLSNADLTNTNLSYANLSYANLSNSDLYHTNFLYTDLSYANLSNTDISFTRNFAFSNLNGTNLTNANLTNVDLAFTNLSTTILDNVKGLNDQCPKEGSFIGWKKCYDGNAFIVKLEIPADAKRCSATKNKCRCSKAKVLEIQNLDGTKADVARVFSDYDDFFYYQTGEIVYPDSFDDRFWHECSHGIHFFMNREDAVNYC